MDYRELDTAADILDAFKQCQNAGEEIQLFESLAERANPPVDAFVEILRKIKLETVLALTIQAFGKITNDDVKATLKGSDDLLAMLCEQAKSGATDLIRWSAATAIENVGFSFINVSQYLTEEPSVIIQRIVQSKVKVLRDAERNRNSVTENNDYDSFIRFWVYGATYELRAATVDRVGGDAGTVVNAVVKAQSVWGIKQTNFLFLVLENQDRLSLLDAVKQVYENRFPLQESVKQVYENQLFESESQFLCSQLLAQNQNPANIEILVSNQIHCLQSNILQIRKNAALILLSLDDHILNIFKQRNTALVSLLTIFSQDEDAFGIRDDFRYQEVMEAIECLEISQQYLSRDDASKYCEELHQKLLWFIKNRKKQISKKFGAINSSKKHIADILNKVKTVHPELYNDYCDLDFGELPEVNVEDDEHQIILNEYHGEIILVNTRINEWLERKKRERIESQNKKTKAEQENREILIRKIKSACDKIHSNWSFHIYDDRNFSKSKSSIVYNNIISFYGQGYDKHLYRGKTYEQLKKDYDDLTYNVIRECNKILEEIRTERSQILKHILMEHLTVCFFLFSPAFSLILGFCQIFPAIMSWAFILSIPLSIIAYLYKENSGYSYRTEERPENHRKIEEELIIRIRENIAIN